MAASAATASSSPGLCPNYAVICSFLERYGVLLDLPELSFPQLERYLQDTSSVPKLLVDLHVKLLRKIGKSVSADRWEKYLVKVCQEFNTTWAWELEEKGYKEMSMECKTGILKYLCECQFDENVKFKTAINDEDPDKMRLQPIGRDKDGQMYWFQLDQDDNVRVYVEEQDDLDGSSWKCIVRDRNDLAEVVALLKTQIDPELLKKEQESKAAGEEDKEKDGEAKKTEDTSDEDRKDSNKAACPVSPKTEKNEATQKDELKSGTLEARSSLNGIVEGKSEAELHSENTSPKAPNIKEEPMEVKTSSETSCVPIKVEKREEVKKNSSEEVQQQKNDQQAKIPLKKRGMKFSEDFEKNGAITVQNPSASKADGTPEQTQKGQRVNDHVNGDLQPPKEADAEPTNKTAAGKSVDTRENIPVADEGSKEVLKDSASHQEDSVKTRDVQEEKETHASFPPPQGHLSKDVNIADEKSLNREEHEKMEESKPADREVSGTANVTVVKGSDNPSLNHEVKSKETESKPSDHVQIETSELVQTKKSEMTGSLKDEQKETKAHKESETSDADIKKSDHSALKEKLDDVETTKSTDEDPAEKSVDSNAAALPCGIKRKDESSISSKTEETVSTEERLDHPDVKEDKSESCKPTEKSSNIQENMESTEKTTEMEKKVNCEDGTIKDAAKKNLSVCRPVTEEETGVKHNLAKPQEDDKAEMNPEHKRTEEAGAGRDKPFGVVEKTNVSKESDQKPERTEEEGEKVSDEQPKKTTTEQPAVGSIMDAAEESEKEKDKNNLSNDKSNGGDSTTETPLKSIEANEEKPAQTWSKTSADVEEPDAQSEKGAEKQASTGPVADPPDKVGKDKSEEEDSSKTQVANGGEAPTEEGPRRKKKPQVHRRKVELQREERQGDSESDTNTGRSLRRSPRISRPTPKAVEIQDKKMEKLQAPLPQKQEDSKKGKEEEEEEEKEEEIDIKTVQRKPKEKKADQEGQPKPKGRKRRRVRWSNTRTRRKKKNSEDEDDNSDEESTEEEESEEEDDSDEDYKVERSRKRRNRNRERRSSDSSTSSDDDLPPNDDPCKHCGLPNHPELILLCDSCDNGYHTACLRPPLMIIPDGEWFCPPCQHKQLCDKLEEQLQNLDAALKKKERAERRKERLIYVGISVENIITPSVEVEVEEEKPEVIIKEKKEAKRTKSWGRRSTRAKKTISYRFDEFDEAIEEAIEEDIKEAEGGGAGRGKDMANITGHRGKDISTILQAEEGKENGRVPRSNVGQRKKKRRRLNDLDSDSTVDEEESEEEFRLSESSEEEFVVTDNETEAESEADSNDNGSVRRHSSSLSRKKLKCRQSSRKRRRPRGYSDDEEDETDDDDEDEIVTEGSSEFSDSDLDMSRRRSRRSQKKQVNYCETSESEGSQAETNRAKMKPRRRQESSESDASFSRDSEEEARDRRLKRRADSSEEDSRQRRRRLALKRRRASEEDDSDSSDDSSEEDRPIRKRVNRIDSDDDDEEPDEKPKEKKSGEEESKGTNPLDCSLPELQSTNGQSTVKSFEGLIIKPAPTAPGLIPHLEPSKNISSTPAAAIAPNGLVGQDMAAQDDEEDDLLGVTDLVDYVCNNEQL